MQNQEKENRMAHSRPIKFRAWDKEAGLWVGAGYWLLSDAGIQWSETKEFTTDIILMQYTGLKDKNGKDIYEGDIVDGMARKYFIKNSGRGMYEFWETETEQGYHWGIWNVHNQLEIIGNIYENPSLLTSEDKQ